MINTSILFLFIAGIFLVGFFGNLFFRKTKISDLVILIIIGFVLGPGLHLIPSTYLSILKSFAPFVGAIALMVLLFEGGLSLNFYKVLKELSKTTIFTIFVFSLTVVFMTLFLHILFAIPVLYAILIGAIVGGTSSAVIVPLIKDTKIEENTKTLLTLESAITDSLCVVIAMVVIDIILVKTTSITSIAQNIFGAYAIAILIATVGGIIWMKVLRDFNYAKEYSYLLTLSFLMFLYVLIEFAKGNGAIGALVFGIILGNSFAITKILKIKEFTLSTDITRFQSEISLFIKAFFFVYLGMIIDLSGITSRVAFISILAILFILLARYIAIELLAKKNNDIKTNKRVIFSLHARGLAAAVLATLPIAMNIVNPFTIMILPIAFLVIIVTNITTTIYFYLFQKNITFGFIKHNDPEDPKK